MNIATAYKEKIFSGNYTLVVGERQSGKTTRLLSESIRKCTSNKSYSVAFVSPTVSASKLASMQLIEMIAGISDSLVVRKTHDRVDFGNGSTIRFMPANTSIRGIKVDLLCIDEATYITNLIEFLDKMLPASKSRMASISADDMASAKGILLRSIFEEILEI